MSFKSPLRGIASYRANREAALYFPIHIYYVDATGGNDANNGKSPATAWQTIGKVNGETFQLGDSILFKRGETWTGTTLIPPSSGAGSRPITFGAYGSGARPIIDGNDTVNCIDVPGRSYLVIRDLYAYQGLDFGIYIHDNAHDVEIQDCEASDCGNDNIIFINGVHHVFMANCVSHDAYERIVGPRISCLEISDGSHDISVSDFEAYGSESAGITIHSHAATDFPYNITLARIDSHDNDDLGIIIAQDNAVLSIADANILISDSDFIDNANAGSGGNIWFSKTGDPYPDGILFDNCRSFTDYERPLYVGGAGRFQRCAFRGQWQSRLDGADGVVFYNCTFYRTASTALDFLGNSNDVTMRNNILQTGGANIIDVRAGSTNIDIDYTLYWSESFDPLTAALLSWLGTGYTWANWLINSGQDANSPTPADALFTNPAANDFTLQAGSPAIDAGVDVGLPFCGTAPDCGAFEFCP